MLGRGARFLAPIAIIAVAVGVYLIVHSTVDGHHRTVTSTTTAAVRRGGAAHHRAPPKPTSYVVKPGDTLSGIAAKTGVSVDELTALNPSVSPNALQTGQRLRLRR